VIFFEYNTEEDDNKIFQQVVNAYYISRQFVLEEKREKEIQSKALGTTEFLQEKKSSCWGKSNITARIF